MNKITGLALSLFFVFLAAATGWSQQGGMSGTSQDPTGKQQTGQTQKSQGQAQTTQPTGGTSAQQTALPAQADPQVSKNMVTADTLIGQKVVSQDGKEVGEVKDVFINQQNGQVGHVVVSSGGMLGMGGDYKIVPWNGVTEQVQQNQLQLKVDQQKFDQAPTLSSGDFDKTGGFDYNWIRESYQHYNYQPSWFKEMEQQSGQGAGSPSGQTQMPQSGQTSGQQPGRGM